jgi:hypothetical protein
VIDTLDAAVDAGASWMAIDSTGRLHVSYRDEDRKSLNYGTFVSGVWTTEEIPDSGYNNKIAVTPAGEPSICYTSNKHLYFASRAEGGGWSIDLADPIHVTSWRFVSSIGVDPSGHAHVVAYDNGTSIYHCTNESGSWVSERLNPGQSDDIGAIALAADGTPRAAYPELCCYGEKSPLYVAAKTGSTWQRELADSASDFHADNRLVLAPDDRPHVAFSGLRVLFEDFSWSVRYAVRTAAGTWSVDVLDAAAGTGSVSCVDLALDREAAPHVLHSKYLPESGESVLYHDFKAGGVWTKEILPLSDFRVSALLFDPNDAPCILCAGSAPACGLFLARKVELTGVAGEPRPAEGLRLAIAPNPMRGGGTISFALGAGNAGDATSGGAATGLRAFLSIYDIRGRVMRSFESVTPFGALSWDGTDNAGRPVAPGIYFVRLQGDERSAATRVTIVR